MSLPIGQGQDQGQGNFIVPARQLFVQPADKHKDRTTTIRQSIKYPQSLKHKSKQIHLKQFRQIV